MSRRSKSRISVLEVLPVFRPSMGQEEIDAVADVIRTGWIGLGPKTQEFEEKFASYVDAKHAIAVNSATAALHLSLLALGVGLGDEVLVPSLTFVSTAHVALYVEAKPVFVDVDEETLCMNPTDLETKITQRSKVVIPVHYGGHPVDLDEIHRIAKAKHLFVVEDASHACGSQYKKQMIGGLSDLTCFSFHAVKNLATGDGGMITTNNQKLADRLRRLRWVGISKDTWEREERVLAENYRQYGWFYEVTELGYKAHMNDLTAAIGLVQLKKLTRHNTRRNLLARRYDDTLQRLRWLKTPTVLGWAKTARHNYVIRTSYRDRLNLFLKDRLISSGVHYVPIHQQPFYASYKSTARVPVTDKVWRELLTLPLYPTLAFLDQNRVISAIQDFGKSI